MATNWTEQHTTGNIRVGQTVRVSVYDPARDRDGIDVCVVRVIRRRGSDVRVVVEDNDGMQFSTTPEKIWG